MTDQFECDICMEDLVNSKALPCGHSLCKKCKMNLLQFNHDGSAMLNCPNLCEDVTEIPSDRTIDDVIKTNYKLQSWLISLHREKYNEKLKCQGATAHEASPTNYCKPCRKLFCKACFDEHECEENDHIKISYDTQKQCYHPICDAHKLFAEFICKQCNNTFLCIYCKNRTHKEHEKVRLDSHIEALKTEINAKLEAAKKITEKIKQSEVSVLKELQNFRQELTEELLLRKYINLNKYLSQLNEEESNVIKEFDEQMEEFLAQRKEMLNSCNKLTKILQDRQETSNLVMMSEQNILLERLKVISNDLSLKVVLHDRTPENHLGQLQIGMEMKEDQNMLNIDRKVKSTLSEAYDITCEIVSEKLMELYGQLDCSSFQRFADSFKPNVCSFPDVVAAMRDGKDSTKLRISLKTRHIQKRRYELLEAAIENNQWTMVKMILDNMNVNVNGMFVTELLSCDMDYTSTNHRYTALMVASALGYIECMKVLLEKNANVDIKTDDGYTAIMLATIVGNTECVKLLLEKNCGVDSEDTDGDTALMLASRFEYSECVKLLLEKNCDVDNQNTDGYTALMYVSENGLTECMKLLLEKNCDLDHKNINGDTALMLASNNGHAECVKLLLEKTVK